MKNHRNQRRFTLMATLTVAAFATGASSAWAARKPPSAGQQVEATVLRHGTVEMNLTLSPQPQLTGPGTNLVAEPDMLSGTVQDRRYDVAIANDRAEGLGPRGKISLALTAVGEHALQVKGLWNGEKVDLVFSDHGISGRMVHHVAGGGKAVQSCRVGVDRRKGAFILGPVDCLGQPVGLFYTIKPAPLLHMHRPEVALLLLGYLSSAPSPPPVS